MFFRGNEEEQPEEPDNPEILAHNNEDLDTINREQAIGKIKEIIIMKIDIKNGYKAEIASREDMEAYQERDIILTMTMVMQMVILILIIFKVFY